MNRKLTEEINNLHRHIVLSTGFLKSTIGTLTISSGMGLIITYSANPSNYDLYVPILGAFIVAVGFIIYYAGDIYNINQSEKLENLRLKRASNLIDSKIEEQQEVLAKEVLARAERKKLEIDAEVAKELQDIKQGVCKDIRTISDGELSYCSESANNPQLKYVRYPDAITVNEIVKIGIDKFRARNEEPSLDDLNKYCYDLWKAGLITKHKLDECITKLNEE